MSSESLEITVHATPDFKGVEKEYERVAKKAKKGFSFFDSKSWNFGSGKKLKSSFKKGWKHTKESASKYHGGSAWATKVGADGSDLDETQHGGFYNTLDKKISAAKDLFSKKKKKKKDDSEEENENSSSPPSNPTSAKQFQIQKAELKIQHANFDKGLLGSSSGPASGGSGGGNSGADAKANGLTAMGMAIPIAGAAFAVAGGILKTISAIGEQYHASMQSQSATIGATGGYVGGGSGYFANSELASANLAKGRITGESIFGKGNQIDSETMKFAASQGKGIGEVVKELETIRKDNKHADLGFLRGGASATGFSNLRQAEYISKLSNISETLRGKGFSGDVTDFSKFAAGMNRTDGTNMDPNRKMSLAEELSGQGRSGAFGGGIFGSLSMANALSANGGDVFKAIRESELNPGKYMSSALSGMDANTRGIISKMNGGSFSEMSSLKFGYGAFSNDNSSIHAGYNKGLELDNLKKETFASKTGEEAAKVGYELNNAMLKLFEENKGAMLKLTNTVQSIEKTLLPVVSTSITGIVTGIEKMCEYAEPLVNGIGKLASLVSPAGILVKPK
ncbi:hypothetical protein FH581_023515 (plasmid) [Leptospira weilii]|uniref:hypothetical protein n=1 Tax=Leptospira weilii TaxID=28184 RepID=UPI00201B69EE|nr:hypothetical protein [Leptospira weilii]UPY81136.1 hypothetical protein FH581_023060 [Leptospira weilii]UPY81219.1 hypothetical protein FH581_023515 [Leptospira weilii]